MNEPSNIEIFGEGGSSAEIQLTVHMVLAARRWRALLDDKLRALEQSSARMEALSAIFNSPQLPSQVDIARRLRIEGPTLTRMLTKLEADGLVERLNDPLDKRTKKLRLTDAGEAALRQTFAVADTFRKRLLADCDPAQMQAVTAALQGLLARLDEGLPDPADPA